MAVTKKTTARKKQSPSKKSDRSVKKTKKSAKLAAIAAPAKKIIDEQKKLRPKSPHRSFRRTYRRDYIRPLAIQGYLAFTFNVLQTLLSYKATFLKLILVYAVMSGLLVGFASQSTYEQLSEMLREAGGEVFGGDTSQLKDAGLLLMIGLAGGLSPDLSEAQQLLSGLLVLLAWLTTVWLLRAFLAGHTPRLRDGLYNAGAPIVPTALLSLLLILQLVPAAVAAIGISAAIPTGLVSQGVESMVFWVAALLLSLLSLYWLTTTLMALVVVTLPGMYPLRALKTAHELVVGRRLTIVLRILWLTLTTAVVWVAVMLPAILFDAWIKGVLSAVEWIPLVPLALLFVSSTSVVWAAAYIYLLYRKVVDDGTAPA